ncbi:proliferating cell nuclear antigen-like [Hibiscus syriacus]|uniref:Proliferating cell nuclear antigen-like n=1 Tax=Hibiscus syriacus TaxID=106335 RepID=A0A6A3C8Q1_HIBSY|nr:proliferating cell nuclear antigen-like [Hibiscus syriacus]
MAGLQYYFFPTDFFYPRPAQSSPAVDSTPPATILSAPAGNKSFFEDEDSKQHGIVVYKGNKTSVSVRKQGEQLGRIYLRAKSSGSTRLEQTLPWIFYHKVIGVSTFFLFVEGKAASPNVSKVLESIPEVKVIYGTKELEEQQAKRKAVSRGMMSRNLLPSAIKALALSAKAQCKLSKAYLAVLQARHIWSSANHCAQRSDAGLYATDAGRVWTDKELNLKLLRRGTLTRIYAPMVIIQGLRESDVFASVIQLAQTTMSNDKLSSVDSVNSSRIDDPGITSSRKIIVKESTAAARRIMEITENFSYGLAIPPLSPPVLHELHIGT